MQLPLIAATVNYLCVFYSILFLRQQMEGPRSGEEARCIPVALSCAWWLRGCPEGGHQGWSVAPQQEGSSPATLDPMLSFPAPATCLPHLPAEVLLSLLCL